MREIVAPAIAFVLVVTALILVFADGDFDDRASCSKTTTRVTATHDRFATP